MSSAFVFIVLIKNRWVWWRGSWPRRDVGSNSQNKSCAARRGNRGRSRSGESVNLGADTCCSRCNSPKNRLTAVCREPDRTDCHNSIYRSALRITQLHNQRDRVRPRGCRRTRRRRAGCSRWRWRATAAPTATSTEKKQWECQRATGLCHEPNLGGTLSRRNKIFHELQLRAKKNLDCVPVSYYRAQRPNAIRKCAPRRDLPQLEEAKPRGNCPPPQPSHLFGDLTR